VLVATESPDELEVSPGPADAVPPDVSVEDESEAVVVPVVISADRPPEEDEDDTKGAASPSMGAKQPGSRSKVSVSCRIR